MSALSTACLMLQRMSVRFTEDMDGLAQRLGASVCNLEFLPEKFSWEAIVDQKNIRVYRHQYVIILIMQWRKVLW